MTTVNNIAHSELTITGYDIIGDVHGCATSLIILLDKMAYQEGEGVYRYTGAGHRKVLFLGDLVDRGPQIRKTLAIVKA
ncbi:MAG: hypothetical protein HRU20_19190, partial [Pseudomonadales bacterium]|nr:hypothetical protein [Pseudomonadales bacterium]